MVVDIPQLRPIWAGDPLSPEDRAKLDAMAAEYDREVAAEIAREAGVLRSVAIPGSLDDLRATCGDNHGPVGRWQERHNALLEAIERDPEKCCGEWQRPGYHGFCSRLGRPLFFREEGRNENGIPILRRCDRCPVALRGDRIGGWYVELLGELEAICRGEIDV